MGQVESCDCYEDRKRARVGIVPSSDGVTPVAPGRLGTPSSSMKIPPGPITALNDHARLLPVTSDEFDVVDTQFRASLNNHISDYTMDRIAAKKPGWITFKLLRVQRVSNPELEKRFQLAKDNMEREWHASGGEGKWQREQVGFVAPEPFNLENVCAKGLKKGGSARQANFGVNDRGIYVYRYCDYTLKHANNNIPLEIGDSVRVIMYRVLPGRSRHIEQITPDLTPDMSPGFHSHSSPSFMEWYLFNEDQCVATHVLTVKAISNSTNEYEAPRTDRAGTPPFQPVAIGAFMNQLSSPTSSPPISPPTTGCGVPPPTFHLQSPSISSLPSSSINGTNGHASKGAALINVEQDEYLVVESQWLASLNGHISSYTSDRIMTSKPQIGFELRGVQKIAIAPELELRFLACKQRLQNEWKANGGSEEKWHREQAAFFGPRSSNILNICTNGLKRGNNERGDGKFGLNELGIYVYRYCDYTFKDANHGAPLEIGETAKVIMFRALPGRSLRISNANTDLPPTPGYHSHSSPNFMEWYMFNDDQLLATYVLTVKAIKASKSRNDDNGDEE